MAILPVPALSLCTQQGRGCGLRWPSHGVQYAHVQPGRPREHRPAAL